MALLAGVGVLAGVAAALLWARLSSDDRPPPISARVGSVAVGPGATGYFEPGRGRLGFADDEPAQYRIVYRLEQGGGGGEGDVRVLTDVVDVKRPFESRLETRQGPPPGGALLSVQVGRLGHIETRGRNRSTATFATFPGVAPSDVRVSDIAEDLVEQGLAERREQRTVAGRRCLVYRTSGPLSAKSLRRPSAQEYADNCLDQQGLVLEELYVVDGRPLSRRVATTVDTAPTFATGTFRTEAVTIPVDKGGGSVREVEPDSAPEGDDPFWQLAAPPAGFEQVGRYSVVPPQADNFSDPLRRKFIVATVSDVYVDGPKLIVVDQGSTLEGGEAFPPAPEGTPTLDAGQLGTAEVHLSGDGAELRVNLRQGAFVRVYGTVPVADLASVLRDLRPATGTGLVYRGGG